MTKGRRIEHDYAGYLLTRSIGCFRFETNKPGIVCGNTAAMLGEQGMCWLAKHFKIVGDRSTHYGIFGNEPGITCGTLKVSSADGGGGGGCC